MGQDWRGLGAVNGSPWGPHPSEPPPHTHVHACVKAPSRSFLFPEGTLCGRGPEAIPVHCLSNSSPGEKSNPEPAWAPGSPARRASGPPPFTMAFHGGARKGGVGGLRPGPEE